MPERIELSETTRSQLLDRERTPDQIKVGDHSYRVVEPVKAGYKSVVWKVLDRFGQARALKLAVYSDYIDRSYLEELMFAAKLEPYPEFANFYDAALVSIPDMPDEQFVGFVEQWIEGETLEDFLKSRPEKVTMSFFVAYAKALCGALQALRTQSLMHDDLHAGNVMLERPPAGSLDQGWRVKVIDTGSLKSSKSRTRKDKDDHRHFIDHLVAIFNRLHLRKNLPVRERRFLREVEALLATMLDEAPDIALRDPAQIVTQFELAKIRAESLRSDKPWKMLSPFEFISAEHIADDDVLVDLFAKSCPWLMKVDTPDPCLLTGPRGCGKSTILRWLSLKAHLKRPPEEIWPRVIGFYVSCGSDLQNRLGWFRAEDEATRFGAEIIHYFNLLVAREITQTLIQIARREDTETYWGLGPSQEQAICSFIMNGLPARSRDMIQGVSRFEQTLETIEAEMARTHSSMLRGLNLEATTPATFLGDLTSLLVENVKGFSGKKIAILVDDFSDHRLPRPVQKVLNRVIWERRSSHIFKLSAENRGTELTDPFGATVELAREMVPIDCGREYISLIDSPRLRKGREFAAELLDLRLKKAGYSGRAAGLIGKSDWGQASTLAQALNNRRHQATAYHGIECIADLCSGDVSTLLHVYRLIFDQGGVVPETTAKVTKAKQHTAIVSASREMLEAIKAYGTFGSDMYQIAKAFGVMVRGILEGPGVKKGDNRVPEECPRIEIDQNGSATHQLTEQHADLEAELVKRSVFIEMEPGRSRHKNVTTLRWHFRRIYLPAFGASLGKTTAIKRDPEWLKMFLGAPQNACDQELRRRGVDPAQLALLNTSS